MGIAPEGRGVSLTEWEGPGNQGEAHQHGGGDTTESPHHAVPALPGAEELLHLVEGLGHTLSGGDLGLPVNEVYFGCSGLTGLTGTGAKSSFTRAPSIASSLTPLSLPTKA